VKLAVSSFGLGDGLMPALPIARVGHSDLHVVPLHFPRSSIDRSAPALFSATQPEDGVVLAPPGSRDRPVSTDI